MIQTSTAQRFTLPGGFLLAIMIVLTAHGVEPRELDQREVNKDRETPVSPETKKRQDGYDAALRQCQSQAGQAKQECVENAKVKYGEMLK